MENGCLPWGFSIFCPLFEPETALETGKGHTGKMQGKEGLHDVCVEHVVSVTAETGLHRLFLIDSGVDFL